MNATIQALFLFALAGACGSPPAPTAASAPPPETTARAPVDHAALVRAFLDELDATMTSAGEARDDPRVKRLVDANVEAMTAEYVRGGFDPDLRKRLIGALARMRDPRTTRAFVEVFASCRTDTQNDDITRAAESVAEMATAGTKLDDRLADSLWTCFTKYRPSKTNSIRGTQAVHDAVLAVRAPSYGDKAIAALAAPGAGDPTSRVNDQLQFWQVTALQVVRRLRYEPAARQLVTVLLTRDKAALDTVVRAAALAIPHAVEPLLAAALDGSDPAFAKLESDWEGKSYVPIVVDVLSATSMDSARDAVLAYVPKLDRDDNRAAVAQTLSAFPPTPATLRAFKSLYAKLPPPDRASMLANAAAFFDASLGPWALNEAAKIRGDYALSAQSAAIDSAIKLMSRAEQPRVEHAVSDYEKALPAEQRKQLGGELRAVYRSASSALDACKADARCFASLVGEPIGAERSAKWKPIKAACMAAMLGNEQTRKALLAELPRATDPAVRLAVALAIDHLAPKGDEADADALDRVVQDDERRKDSAALRGDDALSRVAERLRARTH